MVNVVCAGFMRFTTAEMSAFHVGLVTYAVGTTTTKRNTPRRVNAVGCGSVA